MAKMRNRHFLADHENLAHLLPSIKLMIIARKSTTNRVSQSRQHIHHTVKYIFTIQCPYNNKAQFNHQKTSKLQTERILAQSVAQAEEPRPGESLSLRRVLSAQARVRESGTGASARSRLGETRLAWARCLLARN